MRSRKTRWNLSSYRNKEQEQFLSFLPVQWNRALDMLCPLQGQYQFFLQPVPSREQQTWRNTRGYKTPRWSPKSRGLSQQRCTRATWFVSWWWLVSRLHVATTARECESLLFKKKKHRNPVCTKFVAIILDNHACCDLMTEYMILLSTNMYVSYSAFNVARYIRQIDNKSWCKKARTSGVVNILSVIRCTKPSLWRPFSHTWDHQSSKWRCIPDKMIVQLGNAAPSEEIDPWITLASLPLLSTFTIEFIRKEYTRYICVFVSRCPHSSFDFFGPSFNHVSPLFLPKPPVVLFACWACVCNSRSWIQDILSYQL